MRIWIVVDEVEVELCGHEDGPADFAPQTQRSVSALTWVQGDYAQPRAEGNTLRVWSFTARYALESIAAAQRFLLELEASFPEQAEVWVQLSDESTAFSLPDCFLEWTPGRSVGSLVQVSWMLSFGGILQGGVLV